MLKGRTTRHAIAVALCVVGSVLLVYVNNKAYWSTEPYPGGQTAEEMSESRPDLALGIARLVRVWSLPLGAFAFLALYGTTASVLELDGRMKYPIAVTFLYPILAFSLMLLVLPLFAGILSAALLVVLSVGRRSKRTFWFSAGALAHNVAFASTSFRYLRAWFDVFGD